MLAGLSLGGSYAFLVSLALLFLPGDSDPLIGLIWLIGLAIGAIAGFVIGILIGVAQALLRETPIPTSVIAGVITELALLPLQLVVRGAGPALLPTIFVYAPSALGITVAAGLGSRLPPRKNTPHGPGRLAFHVGKPASTSQLSGDTGLRLRAYQCGWRYRRAAQRTRVRSPRR